MFVNSTQKFFTYMGYYINGFSRESIRDIERLTHPMPKGEAYWGEVAERVKRVALAIFSIPLAAILFVPAGLCYLIAACAGQGGFEYKHDQKPSPFYLENSVKVVALNACFQDPWSPLTGGVVPPHELVAKGVSRVAAVVDAVVKENPGLCLGQEFENLGAQDEFIRLMRQNGFQYFLRDLGSDEPVKNSSGLFVASKAEIHDVAFIPYRAEDRSGFAAWCKRGALTFTVQLNDKTLKFVNVHLNDGEDQESRNRQLKGYVVPLLSGPSVLFGDLNFDTSKVERAVSGLVGFTNATEGHVTCTDAGKHSLRGKSLTPNGQPCTDCAEKIDGIIYDPRQVTVAGVAVQQLKVGNYFLSDHSMTVATVRLA